MTSICLTDHEARAAAEGRLRYIIKPVKPEPHKNVARFIKSMSPSHHDGPREDVRCGASYWLCF